jgi:hypothetical protein
MLTDIVTSYCGATVGCKDAALFGEDYVFLYRLIYEQSRIALGTDNRVQVPSRLAERGCKATGWPAWHPGCWISTFSAT